MAMQTENPQPGKGLCWYGVQKLPPLVVAFAQEIDGVREAEDIEYIHRMRVASRRLRAALPLFRTCFSPKQYNRWMLEITRITRALGEARDADVQISYLRKFLKKHERDPDRPEFSNGPVPAARFLLAQLEKQRKELQVPVIQALDSLEKSRIIADMLAAFLVWEQEIRADSQRPLLYGIPMVAAHRIEQRLQTLLSYEPWISHPEAVAEHHATRIAAKKLRYTLEIYGAAYRNGLKKHLVRVKRVQEILGDLHDCDVWIDKIITLLLKERTLLRTQREDRRPDTATLASLKVFLADKERERRALYRQFTRYWAMLARTRIWQDLRFSLDQKRKKQFRPPARYTEDSARAAVEAVAATSPDVILQHSRMVTQLALMLFDSLIPLHKLDAHDRFLLDCAGILHDVGWRYGQDRHNLRGARMVLAEEGLMFDLPERAAISLVVSSHRGGKAAADRPLYNLLSPEYQDKTLKLASLIRIADGLDYLHNGNVQEIHCIIEKDRIICRVISCHDCTSEKERARAKADLFISTFGKPLVIT